MAAESNLSISGHADRGGSKAAHRYPGLVQGGDAGQDRRAQRRRRRWRQRAAGENRAQRHAFVRFRGHPDSVRVGTPCQDRGQRRVAVLGQPLDARYCGGSFGRGSGDLVDHHSLPVPEHGLPALTSARGHEFDQLRFRLALGHIGCMVPLLPMAYVIVSPCVTVKDASCVEVCPVDCIHSDDAANMYFIDPDECIDCGACVDPCPVDAIFPEDEVPEKEREYIKINADYFKK
jgi:NAD-dependent dihydropyrimidine dehydrogenase PreA subunit